MSVGADMAGAWSGQEECLDRLVGGIPLDVTGAEMYKLLLC